VKVPVSPTSAGREAFAAATWETMRARFTGRYVSLAP